MIKTIHLDTGKRLYHGNDTERIMVCGIKLSYLNDKCAGQTRKIPKVTCKHCIAKVKNK